MSERRERAAIARGRQGFVLRIAPQERALVVRLLDELTELLSSPAAQPATARLFPVVHPDDAEREAEYQRLMRDELVTSRLAGIDVGKGRARGDRQEGDAHRRAAGVVDAGGQRCSAGARHDPRRVRGRRRRGASRTTCRSTSCTPTSPGCSTPPSSPRPAADRCSQSSSTRKRSSSARNCGQAGSSRRSRWLRPGSSTNRLPGISAASSRAADGGDPMVVAGMHDERRAAHHRRHAR